jgi:hypothetical protein
MEPRYGRLSLLPYLANSFAVASTRVWIGKKGGGSRFDPKGGTKKDDCRALASDAIQLEVAARRYKICENAEAQSGGKVPLAGAS